MSLVGIFSKAQPAIHNFFFDALLEESSELITDVTEYPIETGEVGNDHAVHRPLRLTMTVALSDNPHKAAQAKATQLGEGETPNTLLGSALSIGDSISVGTATRVLGGTGSAIAGLAASVGTGLLFGDGDLRSEVMLKDIRELQRSGTLITVVGAKGSYDNVLITNTRTQITKQNEGGLELVVEMRKLIIVGLEHNQLTAKADLPPNDTATTQAQPEANRGEVQLV